VVKINKIYTRTGDDGTTGLVGGSRIAKDSVKVQAYGEVDELNSWIGLLRTTADKGSAITPLLAKIQNDLFDIGAELATPVDGRKTTQITAAHAAHLEKSIDQLNQGLAELRSFVLPGGNDLNAFCHIARTVCRRAERSVLSLGRDEKVSEPITIYLNRLSDLLFVMARFAAKESGEQEYLWAPGRKK